MNRKTFANIFRIFAWAYLLIEVIHIFWPVLADHALLLALSEWNTIYALLSQLGKVLFVFFVSLSLCFFLDQADSRPSGSTD